MRTQWDILELLIGYWDLDSASFLVDDQRVSFTLDNVYFMTGLSHRGEAVNLHGGGHLEGDLSVYDYIDMYCGEGTEKVTSQIPIACI